MPSRAAARPHPATTAKIQRWIDLVAELLSRGTPATFEELARSVPHYAALLRRVTEAQDPGEARTAHASLKRTFERDKDELRRLGVLLETRGDAVNGQEASTYRLRATDFYLPYLYIAGGVDGRTRRVDRYGYRALARLAFTPEELQAVVDAAGVVDGLGNAALCRDAASALRKLAIDLPVDAVRLRPDEPRQVLPRARAHLDVFEALGDAVRRRKRVSFMYHSMSGGTSARREVEPWGLFFLGGHWYLAAHDCERSARRNFRLNRMSDVKVNDRAPLAPDFSVAADFELHSLTQGRHAWELGEGEAEEVVVQVRDDVLEVGDANHAGEPLEGSPRLRRLQVRRIDALIRWIMAHAGEMKPVQPAALVMGYRSALQRTRRRYDHIREVLPSPSPSMPTNVAGVASPPTAAEQWARILQLIPLVADGAAHSLEDVAAQLGVASETLRADLHSLVSRYDLPGGFVEGVQVYLDADRVAVVSNHFRRPMRLTRPELCALELGLAVLRARRSPEDHAFLDSARARVREVLSRLPNDPVPGIDGVAVATDGPSAGLNALRRAIRERRKVRMSYRSGGRRAEAERVVQPQGLVASGGRLYVVAWCERARSERIFRLDRVQEAEVLNERFDRDDSLELDEWVSNHRVFRRDDAGLLRMWYAAEVAPWVAEREGRRLEPDGTLVVDHPLADEEWALRHALQYADGAEVLAPAQLRDAMRGRLDAMLRDLGSPAER